MDDRPDPEAVLHALGWQCAGRPATLGAGWDNHLWSFHTPDQSAHVLRVYRRTGPDAVERARNEAAAVAAAASAGIPVATNETASQFNGAPAFVQPLIAGATLVDAVKRRPWHLASVSRQFGAIQARIHRIGACDGVREVRPDDTRLGLEDGPLLDALRAEATVDTLCHLDYHPLNVMVDRGHLTAVLDWTNAAVSDRRADLAFTETALLRVPLPPGPLNPLLARARRVIHHHWRAGYLAEAGDFPVTPLFRAASVALFLNDLALSVREGRGWATEADLETLRGQLEGLMAAAGFSPSG